MSVQEISCEAPDHQVRMRAISRPIRRLLIGDMYWVQVPEDMCNVALRHRFRYD
jgi:hypothetical protein